MSVDLPAPFGPVMAMRSPDMMFNDTSSNNSRPPNDLESPATVSILTQGREDAGAQREMFFCFDCQIHTLRLCINFIWPKLSQETKEDSNRIKGPGGFSPPGLFIRYLQQEAQSSPQQAAHVEADWQQLPSQDLAGDDAHAAVASATTASAAASRIIFFILFFFLVGGCIFADDGHVRRRQILGI